MNPFEINIGEIRLNEKNPRLIKDARFKKLVQSIREFPKMMQLRPIIIDAENIILGGNMRYRACKELKLKKVWVVRADDLDEEEKQEFIIKDNVGFGDWDWDILANEWDTGKLDEWGVVLWENEPTEKEILTDSALYENRFQVVVECEDEKQQESIYNQLKKQGLSCKVLSL